MLERPNDMCKYRETRGTWWVLKEEESRLIKARRAKKDKNGAIFVMKVDKKINSFSLSFFDLESVRKLLIKSSNVIFWSGI
jgi:hypothetical protein